MQQGDETASAMMSTPPPTDFAGLPPEQSKWPKVIGVISVIYATLGILGMALWGAGIWLGEMFMEMAGMDVTMPSSLKITGCVTVAIAIALGVLLLVGAVKLLQRRAAGVKLLKTWVVLRLVLLVIGSGVNVFLIPPQVEMQKEILAAQNRMFIESGQPQQVQEIDEVEIRRVLIIQTVVFTAIIAVYPLFLGMFLSRKRITEEVAMWGDERSNI